MRRIQTYWGYAATLEELDQAVMTFLRGYRGLEIISSSHAYEPPWQGVEHFKNSRYSVYLFFSYDAPA